jgi:phage host-nuclease inhibitor protein Gam
MKKVVETQEEVTIKEAQRYAKLYAEAENKLLEIQVKSKAEFEKINIKYQHKADALVAQKEECFKKLEQYANANPIEFEKGKSIQIGMTTVGYRLGTWSVNVLSEVTEVIKNLKKYIPGAVRIKEEIDKQKLISGRLTIDQKSIDKCGIEFAQKEYFYVDVK